MTKIEELRAAIAAAETATEAYDDADSPETETAEEWLARLDTLRSAAEAADALVTELRAAVIEADEPREWSFSDGEARDFERQTLPLADVKQALSSAIESGDYGQHESTTWVDAYATCALTGERIDVTVTMGPDEPECTGAKHDWQSPIEIVGGIKENPGVWGHGGGVIITECCMHCGCKRTTDTWAQRPDTGEQGLESVTYEPGAYAEEINTRRRDKAIEAIEAAGYDVSKSSTDHTIYVEVDSDDEVVLAELRAALPGLDVEYTGSSNTDRDGESTDTIGVTGWEVES